jgi:hypothetical protein
MMMKLNSNSIKYTIIAILFLSVGCKKLVDIDQPIDSVTSAKIFANDDMADQTLAGLYSQMAGGRGSSYLSNGYATIFGGLSSDELVPNNPTLNPLDYEIYANNVLVSNENPGGYLWTSTYKTIYAANAIIDGVAASTSANLTQPKHNELIASAKFVRAYCFFYLTNFFGDIPLTLSSNYKDNITMVRSTQQAVYTQMITDLKEAIVLFTAGTTQKPNLRSRATKGAAEALLARTYLYLKDWGNAELYADEVINNGGYSLESLDNTFSKTSKESIFQLALPAQIESNDFIEISALQPSFPLYLLPPSDRDMFLDPDNYNEYTSYLIPSNYLSDHLIMAFEEGDERLNKWINFNGSANIDPYFGRKFYFPTKYKMDPWQSVYVILRLGEIYLIRAEARAMQNKTDLASGDLNKIRKRAGLENTTALTPDALINAIAKERQTELFAEWGHRFFDLKRTGKAIEVLSQIPDKKAITETKLVFPIPQSEIIANPNLKQNPGY